jgi:hypothetical protein
MTAHELAARLANNQFDTFSTMKLDRALVNILRAEGVGKFRSEEVAFQMEDAVLRHLEKYSPQELPFLLKQGGKWLVGKSRLGQRDTPETIAARSAYTIAGDLLDALLNVTSTDFEVVCAASLLLAGACDMHALCTGDEGGIDCYGRLEIRQHSPRLILDIAYTNILPKKILLLGQAKRYARDARIGRPEIQLFKGQLDDCLKKYEGSRRPPTHRVPDSYYLRNEPFVGVFATTASFADTAEASTEASGIVLVGGVKLAQFLAFHQVGATTDENGPHFDDAAFSAWVAEQREKLVDRPSDTKL